MENPLIKYQTRYSDSFSKTEKVATSRGILTLSNILSPKKADLISKTYSYVRVLDDAVDESPLVVPLITLLKNERSALLGQQKPTELQQQYLEQVLADCGDKKRNRLNSCLAQLISGLMIDLNVRYTQNPLNDRQLRVRNCLVLWPALVSLSLGTIGKDLCPNPQSESLMHTWGSYDNLYDITEDLKCGLILINKDDIKKEKLSFYPNKTLPNKDLSNYYNKKRWQIMKSLRHDAPAIFKVGLPPLVAGLGYLYFISRQIKVFNPLRIDEDAVYTPPLDAKPISWQ